MASDEELAEQLTKAGKRLLQLPSPTEELLSALEGVEDCLSMVEQSPPEPVQKALCLSMEVLLMDDILRHPDIDVKAYIAACVSEITRITAPEPPYNDEQMKEFFVLIVSTFEKLCDISSRSYPKRVITLKIMAKIKSCIVMLDLHCDALILEMFQHFLKSTRNNLPEDVFSSMETIMTLVLEESDNISQELLSTLLTYVKKESELVYPFERKLVEKVLQNCACKLKPQLIQAVQSMANPINDYSRTVSFICERTTDTVDHSHINGYVDHMEVEDRGVDATCSRKSNLLANMSQKLVMSTGSITVGDIDSPNLVKASDHSLVDSVKETVEQSTRRKSHYNKLPSEEGPSITEEPTVSLGPEIEQKQLSPQRKSTIETSVASLPSTRILRDEIHLNSGHSSKNKDKINQNANLGLCSVSEGALSSDHTEEDLLSSSAVILRCQSKGRISSEVKPRDRSGRKALNTNKNEDTTPSSVKMFSEKDSVTGHESEKNPQRQSVKKVSTSSRNEDEPSADKQEGESKRKKGKTISVTGGLSDMKMVSSLKPITGSPNGDQVEETQKRSSKRKRPSVKEEISGPPHSVREFGENLVGSRVKVWWPLDGMFYKGVIESFDADKKKHKVLYVDGDVETLNLKKERWEFVGGSNVTGTVKATNPPSPRTSEMPPRKKPKREPDVKREGTSASKFSTSAGKSEGVPKAVGEVKDDANFEEETPNVSSKSKNSAGESD